MKSQIFEIPAEIRDQIYEEVLCYDGIQPDLPQLRSRRRRPGPGRKDEPKPKDFPGCLTKLHRVTPLVQLNTIGCFERRIVPSSRPSVPLATVISLIYTNKQIYREALPIFWSSNAFVFQGADSVLRFLESIGAEQRRLLTKIGIETLCLCRCYWNHEPGLSCLMAEKTPMSALDWPNKYIHQIARELRTASREVAIQKDCEKGVTDLSLGISEDYDRSDISSIDILSEAIRDSKIAALQRAKKLLHNWVIRVERFPEIDGAPRLTWLEKTSSQCPWTVAQESEALDHNHERPPVQWGAWITVEYA